MIAELRSNIVRNPLFGAGFISSVAGAAAVSAGAAGRDIRVLYAGCLLIIIGVLEMLVSWRR